jgi:hypothetical protein
MKFHEVDAISPLHFHVKWRGVPMETFLVHNCNKNTVLHLSKITRYRKLNKLFAFELNGLFPAILTTDVKKGGGAE